MKSYGQNFLASMKATWFKVAMTDWSERFGIRQKKLYLFATQIWPIRKLFIIFSVFMYKNECLSDDFLYSDSVFHGYCEYYQGVATLYFRKNKTQSTNKKCQQINQHVFLLPNFLTNFWWASGAVK